MTLETEIDYDTILGRERSVIRLANRIKGDHDKVREIKARVDAAYARYKANYGVAN